MNYFTKELMVRGSFAGLISGLFLGLFLKVIQHQFGIEVYTLLLNVDYIPVLKEMKFPEIIEISFHLLISIVLGIFLLYVVKKYQWTNWKMVMITMVICLFIGAFLYPTTVLSYRTPSLTSISAFFFWQLGHILYGALLSIFYTVKKV